MSDFIHRLSTAFSTVHPHIIDLGVTIKVMFRDMIISWYQALFLLFFLAVVIVPTNAQAVLPCGDIIAPDGWTGWFNHSNALINTPVVDCADPFNETIGTVSPYSFTVEGMNVADNGQMTIPEAGTVNYEILGFPQTPMMNVTHTLFKHDGNDYQYVNTDEIEPTEADFRRLATEFFGQGVDIEPYIVAILSNDPWNYFPEGEQQDLLYSFDDYIYNHPVLPPLLPGSYTLVSSENILAVSELNWYQKLFASLIPTAQAQSDETDTFTITFTLVAEPPAPTGASSVLFLPGIQASRLYTKNILGIEDELWVPNNNNDVRQLAMTSAGRSVGDIYTKDIVGSVFGLGSVYAGISGYFDNLVAEEKIAAWESFAYDWRYDVEDIVTEGTQYETERKYVLDLVESMAQASDSGKVSLVGHSNGGLLAKVIMTELEKLGKEDLIDQVVFLASPQTGTPKAIGSLLHGYGQSILGGLILKADTARAVMQNLPGVYALLPTKEYFEDTPGEPVIVFEDDYSTKAFVEAYGQKITDVDTLYDFITSQRDDRVASESVYEPVIGNKTILEEVANLHTNVLQSWRAPAAVKVTEVAGIGLPTIHSFAYRAYMKRDCTSLINVECPPTLRYKPVPQVSLLGDETVMTTSAVGYRGDKESYYFNLNTYKNTYSLKKHYNFTEAEPIQLLLSNILLSATNTTPFITKVVPSLSTTYVMMGVHSPVMATITDDKGRQIKVEFEGDFIKKVEEIPDSYIYYFGETTYIILPKDDDYQVTLKGTGLGAVTLELDTFTDESSQTSVQSVLIDAVSTSTIMTMTLVNSTLSDVLVDENGDGEVDRQVDAETNEVIELNPQLPTEEVENSSSSHSGGSITRLTTPTPQVAGAQISLADGGEEMQYLWKLYNLLVELKRLLILYEKIN